MFDFGKDLQDAYDAGYKDGQQANWYPISESPIINGEYLCQKRVYGDYTCMEVLKYSNDLYSVDEYDFYEYKGKNVGGFYSYNSEYGYCEVDYVEAWMELPPKYKGVQDE